MPVTAEQHVAESEQYLDRSVDPETLSIPLVVFPKLTRVIPQSETMYAGWSAYVNAIAPTPARVVQEKKDVPYVIAGTLQEATLSNAAQSEMRRVGADAETGKARSNKHVASLGPAFLLDDDVIDGDVFDREARLKGLGVASFIYSSHSYGFGKMGGRVGVCLNRPYKPDEHQLLWDGINHLIGGGFDKAGRTLSQCYGIHARRSHDAPHKRVVVEGAALNVETAERKQQKLQSASVGDQVIIELAQAGSLPGALLDRPWIARPHGDPGYPRKDQPPGLLDEMRARGGHKLSRLSDHKLTEILKAWSFKPKSLGDSRGWEAPPLPELRAAILTKYPAVEFDERTEWGVNQDGYFTQHAAAVPEAVVKEIDARQAAVQDAVARQATAGQVEVRDLAARQAAALETEKQQKAAREAAERENAAKTPPDLDALVTKMRARRSHKESIV